LHAATKLRSVGIALSAVRWATKPLFDGRDRQASAYDGRHSRAHEWLFDGGVRVAASASPHVVRVPFADPSGVDPEEAFVASIASCHMLFFLSFAAKRGFIIDKCDDSAVGVLGKTTDGREWMPKVTLRPHVDFSDDNGRRLRKSTRCIMRRTRPVTLRTRSRPKSPLRVRPQGFAEKFAS
jgi:organic hydroperoxide reductase OsmC/OhrA